MEFILGNAVAEISLVVFLGLVMGSFASMLCYRLPHDIPVLDFKKKTDNVQHDFSFCPDCKTRLGFLDLFPILSWAFQRGKCRHCSQKISIQYPLIECLTLALVLLGYWGFGLTVQGSMVMAMAPILASLFVIDWNFRILPNTLNLAFFIGGFVFHAVQGEDFVFYLISAIVYPASMIFVRWAFLKATGKDGLGFGDIKFFAGAGMWLGLNVFSAFLLLGSLLGIAFGLIHKWITKEELFPFGPALIVGFLICFYTKDLILTVL